MEHLKMMPGVFGEGADDGQSDQAEGQVAAASDLDAEFEALVKGKYREQFKKLKSEAIQNAIRRRFKTLNEEHERLEKAKTMFEVIARKYGVKDPNDIDGMIEAMNNDLKMNL